MKPWTLILAGLALLLLAPQAATAATGNALASLSYLGQTGLPRGMRNNNPGNIRISATAWQGKIPNANNTDGAFEQFKTYVWGIRAMIKTLQNYQSKHGLYTIRGMINRWAPPSDGNDTSAYVQYVSNRTGIAPDDIISMSDPTTAGAIVPAMAAVENGREAITPEQFKYAWNIV